jgi:hypothetical protein
MDMSSKGLRADPETDGGQRWYGVVYKTVRYLFWSSVGEKHDGRLAIAETKREGMRDRAQFLESFVPFFDARPCALEYDDVQGDTTNVLRLTR